MFLELYYRKAGGKREGRERERERGRPAMAKRRGAGEGGRLDSKKE